ncbi:ankyrin repeat domain-containing protein [Pareuzebyella sediminis]|uniref:ankyrin repeat domain-containing protein n=1 Tax=Pareuzebyella sediminis TaxID=2607998 RepID=UPI0011EF81FD|nr:ankyrin repeat domain-containing protein [Pareuzebyella sediminis]
MRKTIFSVVAACLVATTSVMAVGTTNEFEPQPAIGTFDYVDVSTFCKAIMQGDIDTVRRLIDLGENVNKKSLGMTPAIFAARYNKAEILQLLIDSGADLSIKSDKGYSVKKYAELSNAIDAMAVLEAASGI